MPLKSSVASSQLRVWGNVLVNKKINLIKECLLENGDCLVANLLPDSLFLCIGVDIPLSVHWDSPFLQNCASFRVCSFALVNCVFHLMEKKKWENACNPIEVKTYLLLITRETVTMNQRMKWGYYSPSLTLTLTWPLSEVYLSRQQPTLYRGKNGQIVHQLSFPIIKKRSVEVIKTYFGIEHSYSYVESCILLKLLTM